MSITLYHHPYSRAANVVWMLEELETPYELRFVDIMQGEQKTDAIRSMNPMGKLPILKDGDLIVTEVAAIGLYLADRYASGRLAPKIDDPARGTYLRWSFFAPSVVEPGSTAKLYGWNAKPAQVGWGAYDEMLAAIESAISGREWLLGSQFSMADCIFGGTLRYMLDFEMMAPTPSLSAYADRLRARPAAKRADERNRAIAKERGLGT
ncbi:glutathione S-transferase family protein [Sandaracinus amylolyticus]|uniref:Glutathione S-transferase n=1 Tax=Sandaracinus amylolyticus TaxID=927083 RepID=A0A0F6YLD7_9BACT|nr:glutathione S-transferase family protein [Sandaracinus amylolyticus]AKF10266.1 Glutathione S-transferase [Sandaracinus amylolyticus]